MFFYLFHLPRVSVLQHFIRDCQKNFLITQGDCLDVFYLKWKHTDDQVDLAMEQSGIQFAGIALDQLQINVGELFLRILRPRVCDIPMISLPLEKSLISAIS